MRFVSALLYIILISTGVANAQPACTWAFDADTSYSAKMFVRAEGATVDPAYLANMQYTARQFENWLGQVGGMAPLEFLSLQHRAVVFGDGSRGMYWPGLQMEAAALAGTYRNAISTAKSNDPLEHHQQISVMAKQEIEARRGQQATTVTMTSGIPTMLFQPNLDGISVQALPKYKFEGTKAVYFYPAAKQMAEYLELSARSLEEVKTKMRSRDSAASVLKSLARYYHLMMVGHPFVRANNSLVMAQINVVLMKLQLKPVTHGELDYVVRSLDSHAAELAFVEYVKANQN